MASFRIPAVILAAALAAACAKSVPVTTNDGSAAAPRTAVDRWTGALRQPSMTNTAVIAGASTPGATAAAYGSATITQPRGTGPARAELSVTIPASANRQVAWALYTGSCTTASPPVVPVNELQPIDLDASGSGTVRGNLSVVLDAKATYNLRVYSGARATDVNNVVLCARLGFSGSR